MDSPGCDGAKNAPARPGLFSIHAISPWRSSVSRRKADAAAAAAGEKRILAPDCLRYAAGSKKRSRGICRGFDEQR
jgi:hypothetical protein